MNEEYFSKYLKYKSKYEMLKNQRGGENIIIKTVGYDTNYNIYFFISGYAMNDEKFKIILPKHSVNNRYDDGRYRDDETNDKNYSYLYKIVNTHPIKSLSKVKIIKNKQKSIIELYDKDNKKFHTIENISILPMNESIELNNITFNTGSYKNYRKASARASAPAQALAQAQAPAPAPTPAPTPAP